MKKKTRTGGRRKLIRQMQKLADAKVNDAVKLAYLGQEQLGLIDGLDLTALTEFKRGGNGAVEMKFVDRMRPAERLLALEQEEGEGLLAAFLEGTGSGGEGEAP